MIKRKYDMNLIKYISLFQSITRTTIEDAFIINDILYYVVKEGFIKQAVGKKGINHKKLERIINKRIIIIENSKNVNRFVSNVIYPFKAANIELEDKIVIITSPDVKTRGMLIGRGGSRLREMEEIVKRYFSIDEIKVK